jgi:putative PIN family toxin of toxin-antitoxin system
MLTRLVIDTNVLVAALLHPGRTPDRAIAAILTRGVIVLLDERIEREYRSVLSRPKFAAIPAARRDSLLSTLLSASERVSGIAESEDAMIDPDDRVFVEVARAGGAHALVTGNAKHFPSELGLHVLSPAALLAAWASS